MKNLDHQYNTKNCNSLISIIISMITLDSSDHVCFNCLHTSDKYKRKCALNYLFHDVFFFPVNTIVMQNLLSTLQQGKAQRTGPRWTMTSIESKIHRSSYCKEPYSNYN